MQSKVKLLAGAAAGAGLFGAVAYAEPTTEQKLDALTQEVEQLKQQQLGVTDKGAKPAAAGKSASHMHSRPPSAAEALGAQRTFVGSYGEMHFNNNSDSGEQELDFHRFILFVGHNFTDSVRFFSELELESSVAGAGEKGEIELEQGYIEADINDAHSLKAGLFLIPVGIVNETHEPTAFFAVERNPVESNIIPTTWWEGGLGLSGRLAPGLGYDIALTSGLNLDPVTFNIRNGLQKVSEANADEGAISYRLRWTGVPGLELAATALYQDNIVQSSGTSANPTPALLLETHASYQTGPFGVRALYAQWDLDSDAARAAGKDNQNGWYVESSYRVMPRLGVFARYNEWDIGGTAASTKQGQTNVGVNFWLVEQVVFKFDVQQGENGPADGFNLGVGYMF